ncbi:MAG: sugar transferase [Clostridia bacterium]|nr:sugar transferase [Clostridia bacterium]
MFLKPWSDLPARMQTDEVLKYYNILKKKSVALFFKRLFDIVVSAGMLIVLSPLFLLLAAAIKIDSRGSVFFRQVRVTRYGKEFRIFKFRTMVTDAEKIGAQVTTKGDARITRVGKVIRRFRLDEVSQLIDILRGTMTFVGTRPEVPKYVEQYTPSMLATLLLPAGVTSEASIFYKDEAALLDASEDIERTYVEEVLPCKMRYNLRAIENFSFWGEIKIMLRTVLAVCGKDYSQNGDEDKCKVEAR